MIHVARKSAYDEKIKPNFRKIEQLLQKGHTERQVAESIGIAYSTWCKYTSEKDGKAEFIELIKKSREKPVDELINAMYRSGKGFKTTIKKYQKCRRVEYDPMTGKKCAEYDELVEYEEEIYIPPNFQSGKFLILNWGKDLGYSSEPAMLALKREEFEHKKEMDENNW